MSKKIIPINDADSDANKKGSDEKKPDGNSVKVDISKEAIEASIKDGSSIDAESEDLGKDELLADEEKISNDEDELTELEEEKRKSAEYYDGMLRLKAEFENYKKRIDKEKARFVQYAKESIILRYLSTLDNLERSLAVEADDEESMRKVIEGVSLIYKELRDKLKDDGVERMEVIGKKFDPYFQEALSAINSPNHENDTVIEEITPGYMINDTVLRPAKVVVAKNDSGKKE